MFASIAGFEFRYQLRNPVFWVTAILFFLLTFGLVANEDTQIAGGGNTHMNSPFAITLTTVAMTLFYMFAATAFVANVVVRDDDTKFGPIVRSTRVTKFDYLIGRFTGAFGAAALAFLAVPFAIGLASLMPWLDPETIGPQRLDAYAYAYFALALPSIFTTCAIFFALATATRSMMGTYIGVVVFLLLYTLTRGAFRGKPELETLSAMIDPLGGTGFGLATRYWTAAERNADLVALAGPLLWNRLLWFGLALGFLAAAYAIYRFAERGMSKRQQRRARAEAAAPMPASPIAAGPLPAPTFGRAAARATLWTRTTFEIHQVVRSPAFGILLALSLIFVVVSLWNVGALLGTPIYPVTRAVVLDLSNGIGGFSSIIAIYYAGELVWRERDRRIHEIIDATPIPGWAYVVPKTLALSLVMLATLAIGMVAGVGVQMARGYTDIEPAKYLLWYFVPTGVSLILISVLAIFLSAMAPNKFVGWGLMVLFLVMQAVFAGLGLEHKLYLFGDAPIVPYSDMNGAGTFWQGPWWFRLYWGAIALIMLIAAHLLWRRGAETRFAPRARRAVARLRGTPGALAAGALAVAIGTGGWIFYNTNILNEYRTSDDREAYTAEYERRYLRYERLPQPVVADMRLKVDLYPADSRALVAGRYTLRNDTAAPIRDIHVRSVDRQTRLMSLNLPGATLASDDPVHRYRIYRLARPMAPGETLDMRFTTLRQQRGFRNAANDINLIGNGTFLNNFELAPVIGMNRQDLLADRTKRREYGLPAELRPARLEDLSATNRPYFGGAWTTADITVSTAADQTPIAPGKKVSDVVEAGRRTARFVSDAPIRQFFSIQSARYAERHVDHRGIDLAVFYHPTHDRNVDRMIAAMKASLDYYQASFGPYQFDQARIIEFPSLRPPFAQAFANTMPYSEAMGFMADNRDPDRIDYVSNTTAHEVAHQYWAHQIVGADMQGATMLSETLAEYSALMVMRRLDGPDQIRRFLKFELDAYLSSRGREAVAEVPLERVENQQYLHYRKGAMVMYLLQDRLGEDAINRALRRLLAQFRFKDAPYPRSADLVAALRAEARTPQDQALITDLTQRITVYDLRVDKPTARRRPDGRWDVTVPVVAAKTYADGKGVDRPAPLAEPIDIGLFTAEPGRGAFDTKNVIIKERRPIVSGRQVLRFVTDRKPTHAGIDPYNLYIDRISRDNVGPVT